MTDTLDSTNLARDVHEHFGDDLGFAIGKLWIFYFYNSTALRVDTKLKRSRFVFAQSTVLVMYNYSATRI